MTVTRVSFLRATMKSTQKGGSSFVGKNIEIFDISAACYVR